MTRAAAGPTVLVDFSNLCRDARLLHVGVQADETLLDRLVDALDD